MLPLLKAEVVSTGWINSDTFPAGYGAAQTAPEPLFIVRHISRRDRPSPAWRRRSGEALVGIFVPVLLPFLDDFRRNSLAAGGLVRRRKCRGRRDSRGSTLCSAL